MKRAHLLPLVLLAALGCQRTSVPQVFAPHVEGLTLGYEDPSLEAGARREARRMVRVTKVAPHKEGGELILLTTTTLKGQASEALWLKDGGLKRLEDEGRTARLMLPQGFPKGAATWTEDGFSFRVVGEAGAANLEVRLPRDFPRVGVWVERSALKGEAPRQRTFYLPEVGEVETLEWRGGSWVAINRLVERGFTDAPNRPLF